MLSDKELVQRIQATWDKFNTAEMVLSQGDLLELIRLLSDVAEKTQNLRSDEGIILQFLCLDQVNSAFISNVRTLRIHTFLKQGVQVPVPGAHRISTREARKLVLDFEEEIEDTIKAIL
jgi:hypothetical protein